MTDTSRADVQSRPWHLWVVGIFATLWSAGGAMDYVMTQTRNDAYMNNFTPEQLDFFYAIPTWAVACWAIAVWGGVLGGLLLLMRKRHAVIVFLVSLVALILTAIQNYALSNGMEVMGEPFVLLFTAAIFVFSALFYIYTRAMDKRNVIH
jgi:hypothetical protein